MSEDNTIKIQNIVNDYFKLQKEADEALEHYYNTCKKMARYAHAAMQLEQKVVIGSKLVNVKDGTVALVTGRTARGITDDGAIDVLYQARKQRKDKSFAKEANNLHSGTWKIEGTEEIVVGG